MHSCELPVLLPPATQFPDSFVCTVGQSRRQFIEPQRLFQSHVLLHKHLETQRLHVDALERVQLWLLHLRPAPGSVPFERLARDLIGYVRANPRARALVVLVGV
jgi:hypothetical protein